LTDEEGRELGTRLRLAQAAIGLYKKAYDALLYYGVNFRSLPTFEQQTPDDPMKAPQAYMSWVQRMRSDIDAAVRRKGFKVHTKDDNEE
jgi:hypothetical protein